MRILDKYITKSIAFSYVSCIFVFLFLYIMVDLFSHLDDVLKEHVGLITLLNYYLSFVPMMFIQVSPIACLLSLLYCMGNLTRNNEIIAMRSSGVSIWRICQPVIIFGFLISIIVFTVNEQFLPRAQMSNYQIKTEVFEKNSQKEDKIMHNLAVYGSNNRHFFIDTYHPRKQIMENITMLEHDADQNVISKTMAKEAYYKNDKWLFRKCIIYYYDKNGKLLGEPFYFENKFMHLKDKPADFLNQQQKTMFMNTAQLKKYIERLSKSGASAVLRNLRVDLYNRFTSPFTSLIIILVGIPFAMGARKRGQVIASLGVCLGISFLYYVFNQTSISLGKLGVIPPILSAILSHAIFLTFSLTAIRKLP